MVAAVYCLSIVTCVPPVAAVNQPLKVNPERVGVGRAVSVSLPFAPVCAVVGVTLPLCGLKVTVKICDHCA